MASLEDLRGQIFLRYIVDKIDLDTVAEEMEREHSVTFSSKQYKRKLDEWGYWRNLRRPIVGEILREKNRRDAVGKQSEFFYRQRMVDLDDVEKYKKRNKLNTIPATNQLTGPMDIHLVSRTPPPPSPPSFQAPLEAPMTFEIPERILYKVEMLIRKSFETGLWRFFHNERLIKSSKEDVQEQKNIMTWASNIDLGLVAAASGDGKSAFRRWDDACEVIKPLLQGQYHDIVPNIIWKISDLHRAGFSEVALKMIKHIAEMSRDYHSRYPVSEIFRRLDGINVRSIGGFEDRILDIFQMCFLFYLGDRCYNTFVMRMDGARQKALRDDWEDIHALLPDLSELDAVYGPTNCRPLDVLRLRLEILHARKQHSRIIMEAEILIPRASAKTDDPWQQHYFLIKAFYYGGHAHSELGNQESARHWYGMALKLIDDFRQYDQSNQFLVQQLDMQKSLELVQSEYSY